MIAERRIKLKKRTIFDSYLFESKTLHKKFNRHNVIAYEDETNYKDETKEEYRYKCLSFVVHKLSDKKLELEKLLEKLSPDDSRYEEEDDKLDTCRYGIKRLVIKEYEKNPKLWEALYYQYSYTNLDISNKESLNTFMFYANKYEDLMKQLKHLINA